MLVRVWEYAVPERSCAEFEPTYGADGEWAQLFSASDGFLGTELFGWTKNAGRFLTVDRFIDAAAWRALVIEHRDAYHRLDAASEALTTGERGLAAGEGGG